MPTPTLAATASLSNATPNARDARARVAASTPDAAESIAAGAARGLAAGTRQASPIAAFVADASARLRSDVAYELARLAAQALLDEAELTPKPALVDRRGSGAHRDLTLAIMRRSAWAIEPFFAEMAEAAAAAQQPTRALREELAEIGRRAERAMLDATGGSNAHRGAIWALGLLTASSSMHATDDARIRTPRRIARTAAAIAAFADRAAPVLVSHGQRVERAYGASGARGEARQGFPHVVGVGLPMLQRRLRESRESGERRVAASGLDARDVARLDALMAIMSVLEDTCLLHRGGRHALEAAQQGARAVLRAGGTAMHAGHRHLLALDTTLLRLNASPGGSADLLSAALFLDAVEAQRTCAPDEPKASFNQGAPPHAHSETVTYGND